MKTINAVAANKPPAESTILTIAPVVQGRGHHAYQNKTPMNEKLQSNNGQSSNKLLKTMRVELILRAVVVVAGATGVCINCVLYFSHAAAKSSNLVANTVTLTIIVMATAVDAWSSMRVRMTPNEKS